MTQQLLDLSWKSHTDVTDFQEYICPFRMKYFAFQLIHNTQKWLNVNKLKTKDFSLSHITFKIFILWSVWIVVYYRTAY